MTRLGKEYWRTLTPTSVLLAVWGIAAVGVLFAPRQGIQFVYGTERLVTLPGIAWTAACLGVFGVCAVVAQKVCTRPGTDRGFRHLVDGIRGADVVAAVIVAGVTAIVIPWMSRTVVDFGSLSNLLVWLSSDWQEVNRTVISNKTLFGARLSYAGLIGVAIYSASVLGVSRTAAISRWKAATASIGLVYSLFLLFVVCLMVSQKSLFLAATGGAAVAFIGSTGPTEGRPTVILILVVAAVALWVLQEGLVAGLRDFTALGLLNHGLERFGFYFGNDVGNLMRAVSDIDQFAYGQYNFRFLLRILNEIPFLNVPLEEAPQYIEVRGGGGWPAFAAPWVDFGPWGLFVVGVWGGISGALYGAARRSFAALGLYCVIIGSILLSWHMPWWSRPEFWLNIVVVGLLSAAARYRVRVL